MNGKIFWELSEVYTVPLNWFFIVQGIAFSIQNDLRINVLSLLIYVIALSLFHIATNIFNHYMDYKNATDGHGYKEQTNIIGREQLSLKMVWNYFLFFLILSALLGLYLTYENGWRLLVFGVIGFCVGIFYSAGPKPINSMPIAESFSSLTMGFLIPLVTVYLNQPDVPIFSKVYGQLFIVCLPLVICMFCCLLANNTCDLEEDVLNHRKTLVYYIGKPRAVSLLKYSYLFVFAWIIVLVLMKSLSAWILLILLLLPKGWKNLQKYFAVQDKQKTFPIVLKNFSIIVVIYPILNLIITLIKAWT